MATTGIFPQRAVLITLCVLLLVSGRATANDARFQFAVKGYVHVQWGFVCGEDSRLEHGFVLRRARLKFRSGVGSRLHSEVEIGADGFDLALKDAFVGYWAASWLELVVGLHKMPFSPEELQPVSGLLMLERSRTNDEFEDLGYLGRDIGLTVRGRVLERPLPVGYALGVYNGNSGAGLQDNDNAKQFVERVTVEPFEWLVAGLSSTQRNDSLTGELVFAYGGDLLVRSGGVRVEAELLAGDVVTGEAGSDRTMLGCVLAGGYRFGNLEPVARVERFFPDAAATDDWRTAVGVGLNWYPVRRMQVRMNFTTDIEPGAKFSHELAVQARAGF